MPTTALYRLAGIAGALSALVILTNTARRSGLVPANLFTRGIAPLAECFGLLALTGLYLLQRRESGTLGAVGYALNTIGLAGTLGIDVVTNYVLPYLRPADATALLAGTTGQMFRITSVVFLLGVLIFAIATWRARRLPAVAMALYVVGLVPVALRTVLPAPVASVGLVITAVATTWLASALWTFASRPGEEATA